MYQFPAEHSVLAEQNASYYWYFNANDHRMNLGVQMLRRRSTSNDDNRSAETILVLQFFDADAYQIPSWVGSSVPGNVSQVIRRCIDPGYEGSSLATHSVINL